MTTAQPKPSEPYAHLVDPSYYELHGPPHESFRELRARSPIHFVEREDGENFWAITRHADVTEISSQPETFRNQRVAIRESDADQDVEVLQRSVISLDPPEHAQYRKLVSRRMTPRRVAQFHDAIEKIAIQTLQDLEIHEDAGCDFVDVVAAPLPIAVIAYLLGVPGDDWRQLYRWTNEMVGSQDPENRKPGENSTDVLLRATAELHGYFESLRRERLEQPQDDLLSVLAHATLDGEPLPVGEVLAFYQILLAAGNETTRNATSGGLLAFIEHPEQLARLQADPSLLPSAVEEVLRWTAPVTHFARTASRDAEISGQRFRAGDRVAMFYPSANRDEEVFEDPQEFRIDRRPNPHLTFGVGEHYCLGAHIARLELNVIFRHLIPRLAEVELAGPVDRLRSNILAGVKRLPIRYRLKPPA